MRKQARLKTKSQSVDHFRLIVELSTFLLFLTEKQAEVNGCTPVEL